MAKTKKIRPTQLEKDLHTRNAELIRQIENYSEEMESIIKMKASEDEFRRVEFGMLLAIYFKNEPDFYRKDIVKVPSWEAIFFQMGKIVEKGYKFDYVEVMKDTVRDTNDLRALIDELRQHAGMKPLNKGQFPQ